MLLFNVFFFKRIFVKLAFGTVNQNDAKSSLNKQDTTVVAVLFYPSQSIMVTGLLK